MAVGCRPTLAPPALGEVSSCDGRVISGPPYCPGALEIQAGGTSSVAIPGGLGSFADNILLDGVLETEPLGATGSVVTVGCRILTPASSVLHGLLTFTESAVTPPTWSVTFDLDPQFPGDRAEVSTSLPVNLGRIAFAASGSVVSESLNPIVLGLQQGGSSFHLDTSALYSRSDLTGSSFGLDVVAQDATESAQPDGAVGEVVAGSIGVPLTILDNWGARHLMTAIVSEVPDPQAVLPAGERDWLVGLSWSDPSVAADLDHPPLIALKDGRPLSQSNEPPAGYWGLPTTVGSFVIDSHGVFQGGTGYVMQFVGTQAHLTEFGATDSIMSPTMGIGFVLDGGGGRLFGLNVGILD